MIGKMNWGKPGENPAQSRYGMSPLLRRASPNAHLPFITYRPSRVKGVMVTEDRRLAFASPQTITIP